MCKDYILSRDGNQKNQFQISDPSKLYIPLNSFYWGLHVSCLLCWYLATRGSHSGEKEKVQIVASFYEDDNSISTTLVLGLQQMIIFIDQLICRLFSLLIDWSFSL